MVKLDAKTKIKRLKSSTTVKARFSGANIKIADKYCAKAITGILYPRITENKLAIFINKSLFLRLNIFELLKS